MTLRKQKKSLPFMKVLWVDCSFFICPSTTNGLIHQATMASVTIFLPLVSICLPGLKPTNICIKQSYFDECRY